MRRIVGRIETHGLLTIALIIAGFYWAFDAMFMHSEVYSRTLFSAAIIIYGLLTQYLIQTRKKTQEKLEIILDGSPLPTFVIDHDRRVILWNKACENLTGRSRREVLGHTIQTELLFPDSEIPVLADMVLTADMDAMHRAYAAKRFAANPHLSEAYEYYDEITVQGSPKKMYFMASRLNYPDGQVMGSMEVIQDISRLDSMQKQLQHSQKMEAMGRLAAGMAHEFNNLLAAIQGNAQLAQRRTGIDHPAAANLTSIDAICNRAAGLIARMLCYSRQDAETAKLLQINNLVEESAKLLGQFLPKNVSLALHLAHDLPPVCVDPSQFQQVLMNLGINAGDAMPDGGDIEVSTSLKTVDHSLSKQLGWVQPGSYVNMTIRDTGQGIAETALPKLFEPFYTTKEPGRGTGLGLSIVYSIVKNHSGYIIADNHPDGGARFQIFLPPSDTNSEEICLPKKVSTVGNISCASSDTGKGRTILLVDDEADLRNIVGEALETEGYEVDMVENGRQAVEAYAAAMRNGRRYDLVVMDLAMPVMDGVTALGKILESDPQARVVITTGIVSDSTRQSLEQGGKIQGLLLKPFSLRQLLDTVQRAVSPSSPAPDATPADP